MWDVIKAMPPGVLVFMGYALLVLSVLGLFMSRVVDEAVQSPISLIGVVWMALLAYLIFTMTLVLQKKQAAFGLSIGLTSLLLPLAAILLFAPAGWISRSWPCCCSRSWSGHSAGHAAVPGSASLSDERPCEPLGRSSMSGRRSSRSRASGTPGLTSWASRS